MTPKTLSLFDDVDAPPPVIITEGETDALAVTDAGLDAVAVQPEAPSTMPPEIYHAHPAVSATDLKRAFERGPWYAPWCRANQKPSKAMERGTRIHKAMLERQTIDVSQYAQRPDGMLFNTKEGKAWKAEQEANGLTVVEANEFAFYVDVNRVLADWKRLLAKVPGQWTFEGSVFWTDVNGVQCRCRPDAVCFNGERVTLYSVKTTAKPVTDDAWRRQVESIIVHGGKTDTIFPGYDLSERHYAEGLAAHYLDDASRWREVVVEHIIVPTEGPLCLYRAPVPQALLERIGAYRTAMLPLVADAIANYPACVPSGVMDLEYQPSKWAERDMPAEIPTEEETV